MKIESEVKEVTTAVSDPAELQMPNSVVAGVIKEFVDIYGQCTECPDAFLWSSFVTCFGVLLSPYVRRNTLTKTQPRLYTANIGVSGVTRKSTGAKLATQLIQEALSMNDIWMVQGFGSSEGLLNVLQKTTAPTLLYLDELEILIKKTGIAGGAGITPLHVLFEETSYSHPLKKDNLSVATAHLAILANSTTDRFVEIWEGDHIDSGFLSRWMLVTGSPTKRISSPPDPDSNRVGQLRERLKGLVKEVRSKIHNKSDAVAIDFASREAAQMWTDFYEKEIDPEDKVQNRIDTIGERLMMIVALAQGRFEIEEATVKAVLEFLRYEVGLRRLFYPHIAANAVATIQQRITARLPQIGDSMSRRQLYRAVHGERYGTDIFEKALDGLVRESILRRGTPGSYTRFQE